MTTSTLLPCTLLAACLLALPAPAPAQVRIEAGKNDVIECEDYTLRFTDACLSKKVEWSLIDKNAMLSLVQIEGQRAYNILSGRPPFLFTMQFALSPVADTALASLPRAALADTLRASELRSIENEVKEKEGFSLFSSTTSTDSVGDKKFFVLNYVIKKKGGLFTTSKKGEALAQVGWIYYYLPHPDRNEYVIGGMYWETMPKDWYTKGYNPQFLDCFRAVLGGMEVKE